MNYSRLDAKDHAREHMRGIWAAALNPFRDGDLALDEEGLRAISALDPRLWASPGVHRRQQGEFFCHVAGGALSNFESRWRNGAPAGTIMSLLGPVISTPCWNLRTRRTWARYIVVHAPFLAFLTLTRTATFSTVLRWPSARIWRSIAMWSHPDSVTT